MGKKTFLSTLGAGALALASMFSSAPMYGQELQYRRSEAASMQRDDTSDERQLPIAVQRARTEERLRQTLLERNRETTRALEIIVKDEGSLPSHTVRRHLQRGGPADKYYPLLDQTNRSWDFIASNDPQDHLLNPSNMYYDAIENEEPSLFQYDSLFQSTRDKALNGATTPRDAMLSFGAFIEHIGPFGYQQWNLGRMPTVVEDLQYALTNGAQGKPAGVCWDAALLETAFNLSIGTPAMSVETPNRQHEVSRVWIDGQWRSPNINFGWNAPIDIYEGGTTHPFVSGMNWRDVAVFYNVPVPGSTQTLSVMRLAKVSSVDDSAREAEHNIQEVQVRIPKTSRFFYATPDNQLSLTQTQNSIPVMMGYFVEGLDTCLNDIGAYYTPVAFMNPDMTWNGFYTDSPNITSMNEWASGRFKFVLPTTTIPNRTDCGAYRLNYYLTYENLNSDGGIRLAYLDFNVNNPLPEDIAKDGVIEPDIKRLQLLPPTASAIPGAYDYQGYVSFLEKILETIPPNDQLPPAGY